MVARSSAKGRGWSGKVPVPAGRHPGWSGPVPRLVQSALARWGRIREGVMTCRMRDRDGGDAQDTGHSGAGLEHTERLAAGLEPPLRPGQEGLMARLEGGLPDIGCKGGGYC